MEKFDVVVIGGGPGGYVAAIRATQLGLKVALVEKEHLGGICLNWGCIPTKSLLKSAELLEKIKHASEFGIHVKSVEFDIKDIIKRSRNISTKLTSGIESLLKKNKVKIFKGTAKIEGPTTIKVTNNDQNISVKAKNIIVATGARARTLGGFEPNGKNIWTYKEALVAQSIPKSMIVVGSGAIGIEFASFYNSLGTKVTILEAAPRILPSEDKEIADLAKKQFENKSITFHTGIKLNSTQQLKNELQVDFTCNKKTISLNSEILLMAVGVIPNSEDLGLENTCVQRQKGRIVTNDFCQTAEKNIYAIGDVADAPWLAHKASHEGVVAAEHIAGTNPHKINKQNIPACVYSAPQIASVGLTEEFAIESGYQIKIGRFPFYANGKALVIGDNDGMIKTIFDAKTGELLGAHMIGSDVTELIHSYVTAKSMEGTETDLMETILAHPTLSEMLHESVLEAYGKAIHI